MLRNGTLARLLHLRPTLKYILLHNIDTLGAAKQNGCTTAVNAAADREKYALKKRET
jgi:hypothetical protein